jgi:hypothetical protein
MLAIKFPIEIDYRWEMAEARLHFGDHLYGLGEPVEAEAAHRRSLPVFEQLAAEQPSQYLVGYSHALARTGEALVDYGKPADAER